MNVYTESTRAASQHGARESALLSNIAYWVEKNRKAGINKFNGKYWTYLSVDNIQNKYPYFSKMVIRTVLVSLEKQGLILKGHFGLRNNTCFYTLTDKAETLFTKKDGELDLQNELDAPKEKDMQLGKKGNGGGVPADGGAVGAPQDKEGVPADGGGVGDSTYRGGDGVGSATAETLDTFDDTLTAAAKPLYSVGVDPLLTPKPAEEPDSAAASEQTAKQTAILVAMTQSMTAALKLGKAVEEVGLGLKQAAARGDAWQAEQAARSSQPPEARQGRATPEPGRGGATADREERLEPVMGGGGRIIDYILLAVGIGCLLMSIRNSWLYLTGAGFTPPAALITACFTAVAFSIKVGLIKALACLVIAFSIFSTFSAYYSYYEKEAVLAEHQATERTDYDTKLGAARMEMADIKERVGSLTEEAAYWRDKNWAYFDGFQKNIQTLYGREAELNNYILQAPAPIETGSGAGTVFAAFEPIADFLGITTTFLRLIIFIIPAVFFDVASPLLFANFFRRRG